MIFALFFLLITLAFLIRAVANTFFAVWLWQIKEYRWDRLFVHFKETKEGKRFLFNKKTLLFWLLFFALPLASFDFLKPWYLTVATILFIWDTPSIFYQIRKHMLRRPIFTAKAIAITTLTFITLFILFFSIPMWSIALFVLLDRSVFLLVSLLVLLFALPTRVIKVFLIKIATRKRKKMKDLVVVGITGSYGKSSAKELVASFLSEKYIVLKTPGSVNTDLGIALFLLRNLKPEHEVFVVEIGAYKRGEISVVCNMVRPTISVLTGINEQHLSLFGSLENIKKAKSELIESLPQDGMAFFNGDDETTLAMSKDSKLKNTFVYSTKQLPPSIRSKKNPFLANIAAAYLLAQELGVTEEMLNKKFLQAVTSLRIKREEKDNVTILDDSFNTNPKGFAAALDILANEKGKKILVTPGIIELGSQSKRIHKELGVKMAKVCDTIILTTDNFEEPIREGLIKANFDMINFLIPKREELAAIVKNQFKDKAVVLLEGRVPVEIKSS